MVQGVPPGTYFTVVTDYIMLRTART